MHPVHRHDLPFFTLTGFVDTDKLPNRLVLPFFIKDGFELIIEKKELTQKEINRKAANKKYYEKKKHNII